MAKTLQRPTEAAKATLFRRPEYHSAAALFIRDGRRQNQREREEIAAANAIATDMLIAQLGADEDDSVTLVCPCRSTFRCGLTRC
jgi:rhodanese-related sulfurtransferase